MSFMILIYYYQQQQGSILNSIWEGIDKLWELHLTKTTTPTPKHRKAIDSINSYNEYAKWTKNLPFEIYDQWYEAKKERKEVKNVIRKASIEQRDRVLEERMRKQRAYYKPIKEPFDDMAVVGAQISNKIDEKFGQSFGEVTDLMDEKIQMRQDKYFDKTFNDKLREFCVIYPTCCQDITRCPQFFYNFAPSSTNYEP
ncbi:hypothetical protein ACR3K2_13710 [Cryptosporidium serpentis]